MFDIGFAELIIIGVVALLVIGPERLPEAVRTGSAWLNRLRRGFNDIKQEVQQELHNDAVLKDLRESGEQLRKDSNELRQQLTSPLKETTALLTDLDQEKKPSESSHESAGEPAPSDEPAEKPHE